jgi:hypothetical protein
VEKTPTQLGPLERAYLNTGLLTYRLAVRRHTAGKGILFADAMRINTIELIQHELVLMD